MTVNIAVVGRTAEEALTTIENMISDGRVMVDSGQTINRGKEYVSIVSDEGTEIHFVAIGSNKMESNGVDRFNMTMPCDSFPDIMKLEKVRMFFTSTGQ